MPNQLAPKPRNDAGSERADADGTPLAARQVAHSLMIAARRARVLASDCPPGGQTNGLYLYEARCLDLAAVIVSAVPHGFCRCGVPVVEWLTGGDIACPSCGARRHLTEYQRSGLALVASHPAPDGDEAGILVGAQPAASPSLQPSGDAAYPAIVAGGQAGGSDGLPADISGSPAAVPASPAVDDAAALSRDGAAADIRGEA